MRAVVQSGFGPAGDVLSIEDVDRPTARDGEVLVRVEAAGIAKGNWLITHGLPYIARPAYGFRTPKERMAGLQFAGTIAVPGNTDTGLALGDAVFGMHAGALAEHVAVPASAIVPKPPGITVEQAAVAPISGIAALQAVRDGGKVKPGDRVLVIGASGGVGSFAVQIAKAFGAEVTAVASTRNLTMLQELGADHVVDYTRDDPTDGRQRYDVIIDIAGNRKLSRLRGALVRKGALVIVGGTGGRWTMGFGRTVRGMLLAPFISQRIVGLISQPNPGDLVALAGLLGTGRVTPVVRQRYTLDQVAEAVEAAGKNSGAGTGVVIVQ